MGRNLSCPTRISWTPCTAPASCLSMIFCGIMTHGIIITILCAAWGKLTCSGSWATLPFCTSAGRTNHGSQAITGASECYIFTICSLQRQCSGMWTMERTIPIQIINALDELDEKTILCFVSCCMASAKDCRHYIDILRTDPGNTSARQLLAAAENASSHPNQDDIEKARRFINETLSRS